MATTSEKNKRNTGSMMNAAGSSLKEAARAASGLTGIGSSLGDILRLFTQKGNYTLIRRFMEPVYILRSFCSGKKTVRKILNAILLALSLLLLAGTIIGRLDEARTGTPASIFGIKPVVVMSGSMEPALKTHSLALVRLTKDVEPDDILLFKSGGSLVLHRFLEEADPEGGGGTDADSGADPKGGGADGRADPDSSGYSDSKTAGAYIITGGDNNAEADYAPLPRENILGRVVLPLNFTAPLVEFVWKIREGDVVRTSLAPGPGPSLPEPLPGRQADSFTPEPLPEDEMLSLMNSRRTEAGLGSLSFLPALAEAASVRAREASVSWSHTRPDGSAWYTAGAGTAYGENLAKGFRTAADAFAAWMSSPPHAANILFPGFRYVSIGSYISPAGTRYWSAEFC